MKMLPIKSISDHALPTPSETSIFPELFRLWQSQNYGEVRVDYAKFIQNNPILHTFLDLGACLTWISDLRTMQYAFISNNVKQILGYSADEFLSKGLSFITQIMHPSDLPKTGKLIKIIWDFLLDLPVHQRQKYRFNGDYRIIKPDGSWVRILEQNTILQLDKRGNITHLLGVGSDITHWKKSDDIVASVFSAENDTCLFYSPEDAALHPQATLSKREREILRLMAEGYNSKLIADKLFISFHTVNTHRQNIIEKTHTKNASGMIQFAICHGLI